MARPFKTRIIGEKPKVDEFKPRGIPSKMIDKVYVTLDEYEAIRLADYLGLEHIDAAELMDISRPTFTKLVERARHKVSQALVEAKSIVLEGGDVIVEKRARCDNCGIEFLDRPGNRHRCGKYSKNKRDLSGNGK